VAQLQILKHPLAQDKLTRLRDKATQPERFRRLVMELAEMLVIEATRDLKTKDVEVETPLVKTRGPRISEKVTLVPVMRAGLAMLEGAHRVFSSAAVGHIGIYRDKFVRNTVEYYFRLPPDVKGHRILLLDPMLATGDTASAAISRLKECGVGQIQFLSLLASKPGLKRLKKDHPDVVVWTLSEEPELNDHDYILPGIGDAGDRIYGTVD
jgi:uracil phosphoribosyltransferase